MIDHDEGRTPFESQAPAAPRWPAKWRRQHYRDVAAKLIFRNKSRSLIVRESVGIAVGEDRDQCREGIGINFANVVVLLAQFEGDDERWSAQLDVPPILPRLGSRSRAEYV